MIVGRNAAYQNRKSTTIEIAEICFKNLPRQCRWFSLGIRNSELEQILWKFWFTPVSHLSICTTWSLFSSLWDAQGSLPQLPWSWLWPWVSVGADDYLLSEHRKANSFIHSPKLPTFSFSLTLLSSTLSFVNVQTLYKTQIKELKEEVEDLNRQRTELESIQKSLEQDRSKTRTVPIIIVIIIIINIAGNAPYVSRKGRRARG